MKLLDEGFSLANTALQWVISKEKKKFKQEYLSENGLQDLMDQKDALEEKKKSIQKQIHDIERDIEEKDGRADREECNRLWIYMYYNKSDLEAEKKSRETVHYKNLQALGSIWNKFKQKMALAIGAKEQRSVLGEFYHLNWTDLGIELPIDVNIGDITIEWGEIKVDAKRLESMNSLME